MTTQLYGAPGQGAARDAKRRTRRLVIRLCIASAIAVGAIIVFATVAVVTVGAAGGCGGPVSPATSAAATPSP